MRIMQLLSAALACAALFGAPALAAETVLMKDGATYHGDVVDVTDSSVVMDAEWPPMGRVTLEAAELRPRSWWQIRTARLGDDGTKRLALAEWAESQGLLVQAVSELRKARRDPSVQERADAGIARLERRIAINLLDRGEAFLDDGRPSAARRYFEIILRRYASTDVAEMARAQLEAVDESLTQKHRARAAARAAQRELTAYRRQADAWDADLKAIRLHLQKADELGEKVPGHARTVRDSRHLRQRAEHLEVALTKARQLGLPPENVAQDSADRVRASIKAKLVEAYLQLGEGELLRGSVARAEDWCTRACDLEPEERDSHELHEKIIDALLLSGTYRHTAR